MRLSLAAAAGTAGTAVIAAALLGIASLGDRITLAQGVPIAPSGSFGSPNEEYARGPMFEAAVIAAPPDAAPSPVVAARRKIRCTGCGTVESVRRLRGPDAAAQACSRVDGARLRLNAMAGERASLDPWTLGESQDAAGPEASGADAGNATWRYRITVRFRDGSRHVFDEATARSLQAGERVRVIGGAGSAAPAATALAAYAASDLLQP